MSFVKRGFANVFLQMNPIEEHEYLTSTGVGDVNIPKRPRTIKYDPDIRRSGEFVASEFIRGEPGEITAPFSRPLDTVQNYLQELGCAVNARINYACRGDRNIFFNYELAVQLLGAEFESGNIGQPVAATPDQEDRVMTGGDLKALGWTYVYLLEGVQSESVKTVAGVDITSDICSIVMVPEECGDRCGRRIKPGCEGLAGLCSGTYVYQNQVVKTINCNTSWVNTANDPFGGDKDVTDWATVETATGVRVIGTGEAVAGTFSEISYLDVTYQTDYDSAWTDVVVGNVAGQGLTSITVAPNGWIWVVATDGRIYVSKNIGLTWTRMHDGSVTSQQLNGIVFVTADLGFAVGNSNVVLRTTNKGDSWSLFTGPAAGTNLTSIDVNREGYLFVTASDATMHRSIDNANSWAEILNMGGGSMPKVEFDPDHGYYGYALHNPAAGQGNMLRSEDGGVSWLQWTTPTNTGLNDLFVVDANMVYICGNAAFIAKFDRAAS